MNKGHSLFDPLQLVYVQMAFHKPDTAVWIRTLWQEYQHVEAGQISPKGSLQTRAMPAEAVFHVYDLRIQSIREKYPSYGDQEFLSAVQVQAQENKFVRLGVIIGEKCTGVFTFHPYFAICTAFFFLNRSRAISSNA